MVQKTLLYWDRVTSEYLAAQRETAKKLHPLTSAQDVPLTIIRQAQLIRILYIESDPKVMHIFVYTIQRQNDMEMQ